MLTYLSSSEFVLGKYFPLKHFKNAWNVKHQLHKSILSIHILVWYYVVAKNFFQKIYYLMSFSGKSLTSFYSFQIGHQDDTDQRKSSKQDQVPYRNITSPKNPEVQVMAYTASLGTHLAASFTRAVFPSHSYFLLL